jgi:methylmalonyl-CoA mutase
MGHDAAINIMRRIIQSTGAEVIHLGHDRSVEDVVNTAIQEDAHAIAMTSYQGGHTEYFKYMHDLLKERRARGTSRSSAGEEGRSCPSEIKELQNYGITRLYHPDDGRAMGLQGMINDMLEKADYDLSDRVNGEAKRAHTEELAGHCRLISTAENHPEVFKIVDEIHKKAEASTAPVLGITGTGGAGKSSMVDELIRRFHPRSAGRRPSA